MSLPRTETINSSSSSNLETAENADSVSWRINHSEVTITSQIGTGNFASVYKGNWRGKDVAVKKIRVTTEKHRVENNEKNIMVLLTKLGAPNVVKLHGYNIISSVYTLVMEYMPNGSLADLIDQKRLPPGWQFCTDVMRNISSSIVFMHVNNIIHRDIKTPNIVFDVNMQAKLCDFGLAKFIDDKIQFVGTVEYLAPEITREPHSKKSDVFSLSVTLWEIVAGRNPYASLKVNEIYDYVDSGYRERVPRECPPGLAHLITWGWTKNPGTRPTARQFLDELNKENIIKLSGPGETRGR